MPKRNQMKHLTISLNSASYKKMRQLMETYFSDKVIFVYEEDEEDLENSLYEKIVQDAKENFLPVDIRVKQILNLYYSGALVQENKLNKLSEDVNIDNTLNSGDYISKLEERIKQLETNISLQASMQNNMGNVSIVSSETKSITSNTTKITQENSSAPNITHTSNTSTTCNTSEISNSTNDNNNNNNNNKNLITAEVINAEVINAEIINAEVVDAKVINTEVLDSEIVCAEVVDTEIVGAEVINAEVIETKDNNTEMIDVQDINNINIKEKNTIIEESDVINNTIIEESNVINNIIIEEKNAESSQENNSKDIGNNKLNPNLTTVDGFLQVASNVLFDDNIEIVSDFNF